MTEEISEEFAKWLEINPKD